MIFVTRESKKNEAGMGGGSNLKAFEGNRDNLVAKNMKNMQARA